MTPHRDYRRSRESTLVIFDLRVSDSIDRLQGELAAWQGYAEIEVLDLNHAVLIIRPGAARKSAP